MPPTHMVGAVQFAAYLRGIETWQPLLPGQPGVLHLQPTYEGLKLGIFRRPRAAQPHLQPTYEGLKPAILLDTRIDHVGFAAYLRGIETLVVLLSELLFKRFAAYLRGIETSSAGDGKVMLN